jgi:hypothetical protein
VSSKANGFSRVLLFQSVMLASLASVAHSTHTTYAIQAAPIWAAAVLAVQAPWRRLQLAPQCGRLANLSSLPCFALRSGHGVAERVPAAGRYADHDVKRPVGNDRLRPIGGFVQFDIVPSPQVRSGPELSWSTPDSPREDLQKMRLLSPGWGVSYSLGHLPIAVGLSAFSRIVMVGKQMPVVDPLTSEARVELSLP